MDRSIGDMPTLPGGSERSWEGILEPGSFFGRYKVHRFLGRGGMGEVYEVEHELDGAHYAMKVLSSEIPQTPENVRRFEREAQVMARLEHPNVISVDYFDETNGKYWFRMELARGIEEGVVTLGDLAARNGGRIGQGLLVCLFEQILDGLSCAHEKGVIHRDLKPGNILLAHSDELAGGIIPKISDFGLVRLVGQDWLLNRTLISTQQSLGERATEGADDSQGLSTQSLVGTYAYMSPEQKQGKQVDERSDIYAVGLMIYRLLTGYANPGERIRKKDSSLRAFWQKIVDQSVREDPEDRFVSAAAMLVELRRRHKVLASLDGKASLRKSKVEFEAKRCYTANSCLEESGMIFSDDPEVLEFRAMMREQLGILQELKTKMQDFVCLKKYDDALAVSEQFCAICIEDEGINKFIAEYPQLVIQEQLRQLIEEASRLLEAEEFEAASQVAQKALLVDPEDSRAKQIHDQALGMLKKMQMQQTREQVNKGLQKTHSLLRQKRYAKALDTLRHTPCSDSRHPTVIALRNACQSGLKKIRQHWERAEEARKTADYQAAISLLNKVLDDVAPEDPGTIERLNRLKSEVGELSAASIEMDHAWDSRSYKKCLAAADRILAFQPEHPKAKEYKQACTDKVRIIQPCIDSAEECHRNQQYDKAVAALEQAKVHYRLGRRAPKNDAGIETQHAAYSPEYKEIVDKISVIRRAKASMEQALDRAKERLEARDLLEARLALNDYFELKTDGDEGLLLQQELESLHRRATMMRRLRRSVIYLAVVAIVGLALAYGLASLIMAHRMRNALEGSVAKLSFENLKMMPGEAALQLSELRQPWFYPLSSIDDRWNKWIESLERSESAWNDYTRGAYEEGLRKLENMPPTEFRSLIQSEFDTFEQKTIELCADVNDMLVKGEYDNCVSDCNSFRLHYPDHNRVNELLKQTIKAQTLETCVWDPNVDLISLSDYMRDLIEISPRHHERQKLEEHCLQRVKSKYDFWDQPLPDSVNAINDINDIIEQIDLCNRAQEELTWFKQCDGFQPLYETVTTRKGALSRRKTELEQDIPEIERANLFTQQEYWGKAKLILENLDSDQRETFLLQKKIEKYITQLNETVIRASKQVERDDWFDAETTIHEVWIDWKRDDTHYLLERAKELEDRIGDVLKKEREDIRVFLETLDQHTHDQIVLFLQDRIENNPDLMEVYDKCFIKLNQDVQDLIGDARIDTALKLLSDFLENDKIINKVKNGNLKEQLRNLKENENLAIQKQRKAQDLTDNARISKTNDQCPEALWYVHWALEANCEYNDANSLRSTLQILEGSATQSWREAKSFYDDKYYFHAQRKLEPVARAREFPGDVRMLALLHDIDEKVKAAEKAAEDVKNRRQVKDFYDDYRDYEFAPDVDPRIKKEYQDVADKYGPATKAPPSKTEDLPDPDWCQIRFPKAPDGVDVTIEIEECSLKAPGTVFVRSEDRVSIMVSNKDRSRTQAINIEPWKEYEIKIRDGCLQRKKAEVQVVRKGWPFKQYDVDAMVDQITKVHRIDEELARKSLKAALEGKKNVSKLQVDLIDCWQDPKFMESRNRPTNDSPQVTER